MKNEHELKCQRDIIYDSTYLARISGLRELIDMLSHEISQPLMVISAYASGSIRRLEENIYDKQKIIDAMQAINHQVDRAGIIIQCIKECIPKIECHYTKVNIHSVIENVISLIMEEFQHIPFEIFYEFAKNISVIEIDETQIKLVILYLIRNGIEEMLDAKLNKPKLIIETSRINEHTISISIKDQGRGIPAEMQNKLFNFYFTTKSKNIGMSLVTCKSIMDAHSGEITAQSLPEGGAVFRLMLPIIQEY